MEQLSEKSAALGTRTETLRDAATWMELARVTGTELRAKLRVCAAPGTCGAAWMLIVVLTVVDEYWADRAGFVITGLRLPALALIFLATLTILYGFSGRSVELGNMAHFVALWVAFSAAGAILTYLVASLNLPLRDAELAEMDLALGFDWPRWSGFVEAHWLLKFPLVVAYVSLPPQIVGSIIYFSHTGRPDRNEEFLWATIIALIPTTLLSGIIPAAGPHYYFRGLEIDATRDLLALRDGQLSVFALGHLRGIIAMPSFHTVFAILLTYVHRPPARSFSLVMLLNCLMLISIPSEGCHYLVDMIVGAAIAALSIAIVKHWARRRKTLRNERFAARA